MFQNNAGLKPIRVYENDDHFLVEIHASQKLRASRIAGRRWDASQVAWVYPKTLQSYEALKNEFQRDADSFEIRKPKRKPVPEAKLINVNEEPDQDFEREWKELSENTSNIHSNFSDVAGKIDFLVKTVQSLEDSTASVERMILAKNLEDNLNSHGKVENSKEVLNLDEQLEAVLNQIAFESSGQDESLKKHLQKYNPLSKPERFVMRTHEHLLHALAEIAGDRDPTESAFSKYVHYVKDNRLVENTREKNVPAILFMLNGHRNQIVHSRRMPESELKNRAISYLMGLAQVWSAVAAEPVEDFE